jgi:ADP-ribose pyrophosphatase
MWKTISSKELFNHPRLTLIEDVIILPNGNKASYLRYKDDGSCAVTIIAKKDRKILFQREYSYPSNQKLFQFPGGVVPVNEEPEKGANRELMEEMGYKANQLKLLGSYLMDNRRSTQQMHVFLAIDLIKQALEKDIEEEIESYWFSEDKIARMIKNGEIINVHSLASWCLYKNQYWSL